MAAEPELTNWNYFSYFTEVEEHFQRTRGSGLFLLSPLGLGSDRDMEKCGNSARGRACAESSQRLRNGTPKRQGTSDQFSCILRTGRPRRGGGNGKRRCASQARTVQSAIRTRRATEYLVDNAAAVRQKRKLPTRPVAESLEKLSSEADKHYSRFRAARTASHRT